ncbi:extensin family protein [Enterobacter bugandensis]|uniref:extensin-like domain-containing protein n=1 Tax=Enterobacter TaxID=547 RepID=UPI0006651CAE|nr:extensin family protein [Enterobacter bugandensis]MBE3178617.1 extensin family protein [Enterobacter cloacae complex sp. P26RS]MBE3433469.1 extensin family protein [Enterobacter cloacae complex sp. P21RS]MBE3459342.1 extensin family protein [Enterobacter cloacae complex sp. P21C]MBE3498538.1 extensin family protein [Enterobacter cloacae complex sp. P2B]MBE3501727.1 extensin family protein [Enterobacter cloacae complex sp. I11]MBE3515650.1 extensin family protein [Enterobacter cloacae compl
MKGKTLLTIFILGAIATAGYRWLPSYYNPFTPLNLDDPPGRITQYKLRRLTPEACASLLAQANQKKLIRTQAVADSGGECPLNNVVRVRDFGPVSLNGSFLASCPLALSSALFVSQQARPLTKRFTGSELTRIEHLGSFACRNIYHRPDARRSEHATAEALDIAAFRLANGERVTVLNGWKSAKTQPWLKALLAASCGYYGNGLGPEYNAAHASHFHLGMRGFGLCR